MNQLCTEFLFGSTELFTLKLGTCKYSHTYFKTQRRAKIAPIITKTVITLLELAPLFLGLHLRGA